MLIIPVTIFLSLSLFLVAQSHGRANYLRARLQAGVYWRKNVVLCSCMWSVFCNASAILLSALCELCGPGQIPPVRSTASIVWLKPLQPCRKLVFYATQVQGQHPLLLQLLSATIRSFSGYYNIRWYDVAYKLCSKRELCPANDQANDRRRSVVFGLHHLHYSSAQCVQYIFIIDGVFY